MSESQKPNSWSRGAAPHAEPDSRRQGERGPQVEWLLKPLLAAEGDALFDSALANPLLRLLTAFAKRRVFALGCGLLLIAGSAYCAAAPAGSMIAGLPVELCSVALAGLAILLALLVTIGAWLRPLESVEDAVEILSVPLIAFEKGGTQDVR